MILSDYVQRMARYNEWQNSQINAAFHELAQRDSTAWTVGRKGFWGSLIGTMNHVLWADHVWMARFENRPAPVVKQADSAALFDDPVEFWEARKTCDKRIRHWADRLTDADLSGDLTWFSGSVQREISHPLGGLVVHFFNHQTHHRGQVHCMLTQAGVTAPVTDYFLMPEQGDFWE